ncbi:MAG TPA: maleylpyruvate isomerase family mycothiol-dependent enzyme, partial [Acidimicrobiales bacterium]
EPGPRPHVKNPMGEFNEREVEARRDRSGAEVLAELEALVALRLETLRNADDAYFEQERVSPMGPGTMLDFLSIRILDCYVHEQDIRRAVGQPGHLEGGPAEHTTDRMLRTLPLVVGKRAAAPEGSITVLRLDGPVERTVPVMVEGGRAKVVDAVPAGPPMVSVTMDSETFLVLAVGRQSAADRSDHIAIEGDASLGQAIVDNMNMMI